MSRMQLILYDLAFKLSLVLSWTLVTALLGMALWWGPHTRDAAFSRVILWFFTVVAPTIQAVRLRRQIDELARECRALPDTAWRDVYQTQFALLMFGSMTVLGAFATGLR